MCNYYNLQIYFLTKKFMISVFISLTFSQNFNCFRSNSLISLSYLNEAQAEVC